MSGITDEEIRELESIALTMSDDTVRRSLEDHCAIALRPIGTDRLANVQRDIARARCTEMRNAIKAQRETAERLAVCGIGTVPQ